jgi:hypothetical protein
MDIMEITRVIGSAGDQESVSQEIAGPEGSASDTGEPDVLGYKRSLVGLGVAWLGCVGGGGQFKYTGDWNGYFSWTCARAAGDPGYYYYGLS